MASTAPAVLRAAAPLVRVAAGAARTSAMRSAAGGALRWVDGAAVAPLARHSLTPAAVRIERGRWRRGNGRAGHTAITVWFGEGPRLPAPGGNDTLRGALRVGSGVLAGAALAAMTVIAARREEGRRVIEAPSPAVPIPAEAPSLSR